MNEHVRRGCLWREIINDLKLRPEDAAADLGVTLEEFHSYLSGEKEAPAEIVKRAVAIWPENERNFYITKDDCPEGVKLMSSEESAASSRVMARAGQPYYEYRHTATSTISQFRPEWIQQLSVVDNNDPEHPAVQWNNGHKCQQFTYFVGPVNFYYRGEDGKKEVAVMNSGDSMHITPFVPHTFTTRKNEAGKKGLILALTYDHKLTRDMRQELSALGPELAAEYALDFSTREKAAASLLRFHREAASVDYNILSNRANISVDDLVAYEKGQAVPSSLEIKRVASALNINYGDLLPPDYIEKKVIVKRYLDASKWWFPYQDPAYQMVELAGTKHLPYSKSLEVNLLTSGNEDRLDLKVGLHQYAYNVGERRVQLNWKLGDKHYDTEFHPGDSFYMKPFVAHNFRGKGGKLLILRIGGKVAGEAQIELSLVGKENIGRVIDDALPWFNKEGRNKV